ncbi:hypothetical protein WYY_16767 [Bacillus velezensis M27]|uniref:Uncharacterized protein n=1 Tax=Bacillus amyloliquefaciens TaxID=1390 RepID=A0AAP7N489_BACAM|nr:MULTISPECIES: hypothetical protein [Bacteria]ASF54154.1 hypothetical protein CEG11_03155 [Bacillus velezensis]ASZ05154.1 hypothetical protein CJP14_15455 [Bacillus velezensis]EKE46552.1 hypothetical protein WYY_16767 [Bacillus velezensis M27]MBD0399212.1 hypothetical protein [Bacillus sp. 2211]MBT2572651.1 hypothetical protein [Bacillus sp. ISL-51]
MASTKVYACLCGEWVDLTSDPDCKIGESMSSPYIWWEEGASIWSPNSKEEHTMYQQDYVNIYYKNAEYRIHPMFIQIKYSS